MSEIEIKRGIGLSYGIILALNGAFGIEFFVLLEHSTFLAGPAVVLSLFLCGVITMITLFSYCELGASISRVGGEYTFAKVAFGGFTSFLTGWMRWLSSVATIALAAAGFAQFFAYFFPANASLVSILLVVIFTFVSVRGTKEIDIITVMTFILVFALLVALGLQKVVETGGLQNFMSLQSFMPKGVPGVLASIMYSFSMFVGARAVVAGSPQMRDPKRDLPRAILSSIAIITVLYCSVAFIVVSTTPLDQNLTQPLLTYVAENIMGPFGGLLMTIAGLSAALMSLTTTMMVQRSIIRGLSRDGYFPGVIASSESKVGRYLSVGIGSIIAILLSVTGLIVFIGYIASFASLMVFALVNLSLIKIRRDRPRMDRPFKAPLYPYTPMAGVVLTILLLLFIERSALLLGLEFIIIAIIIYHLKMVGYHRLRLAVGGVNLGVSGITALIAYMFREGTISLPVPENFKEEALILVIVVSLIFLMAGILNIISRKRKEVQLGDASFT